MEAAPAATRDRTGGADELHPRRLACVRSTGVYLAAPLPEAVLRHCNASGPGDTARCTCCHTRQASQRL